MKKRLVLTCGVLLSGLWAASAMAAESGDATAAPLPQGDEQAVTQGVERGAQEGEASVAGTVPQAQVDLFNKREEARKRRDEALKVRAQMIQSGQ
jgi:hypothetical protein